MPEGQSLSFWKSFCEYHFFKVIHLRYILCIAQWQGRYKLKIDIKFYLQIVVSLNQSFAGIFLNAVLGPLICYWMESAGIHLEGLAYVMLCCL